MRILNAIVATAAQSAGLAASDPAQVFKGPVRYFEEISDLLDTHSEWVPSISRSAA